MSKQQNNQLPLLQYPEHIQIALNTFSARLTSFLAESDYMLEICKVIMHQKGNIKAAQAVVLQELEKKVSSDTKEFCKTLVEEIKKHNNK